ncbi:MAG: cysteine desulfurase family protein [bacterium]|nr:cysteine desulfurase family protein [bacterium]
MRPTKIIYLDHAATTPPHQRVVELMNKLTQKVWGNPSSVYTHGKEAKKVLENTRQKIAGLLGVKAGEIIFTGSGTESDNMAILGTARAHQKHGRHVIISAIEHLAVLKAGQWLEKEGFQVTYLPVNSNGIVNPEDLKNALRKDTILISLMQANNEIGTIQPVKEVAEIVRQWRKKHRQEWPFLHTDACQGAGYLSIQPHGLGVDLLTINGSKIYGPKGVGILYKKNSLQLEPMLVGGSQENGWRAGTENVALAAGMALALEIAEQEKNKEVRRLTALRGGLIKNILKEIPETKLNGDTKKRLPNNINLSFQGVDGEMLVLALNQRGVEVSTGSACTTAETGPSHVLKAIGSSNGWGNIRITLGRETTRLELKKTLVVLKKEVDRLRSMV